MKPILIVALLGKGLLTILITSCLTKPAYAGLIFPINFNDPGNTFSPYYQVIESHVNAAGSAWSDFIPGDASLEVQINFSASVLTATGRSLKASYVRTVAGIDTFEQGAAYEIRTGEDPNQTIPDIQFTFGTDYLMNELWFDPDPFIRTESIADNKTDALSVVLHEFGHAFAINGWTDPLDGSLPGNYQSTFDEHVFFDGTDLFFQGPGARKVYGGDVPLTMGNSRHLGNKLPRPGNKLILDLMNGVYFFRENRYYISPLDVAILADSGLATIPNPSTLYLFGFGLIGIAVLRILEKSTYTMKA